MRRFSEVIEMALNDVRLFGQLIQNPKYYKKKNAEEPYRMTLSIKTMSRYLNSTDRTKLMYDEIVVMSKSPETIVYAAKELRSNDIVYIKGMLCTTDVKRKFICSSCENEIEENGFTCYVHPIKIVKVKSGITAEDGNIIIQDNAEVSNEVILDGTVCSDIHYLEERRYAYYKLAVKRSFHILEDDAEKRMDYPAINTYHDQAYNDSICAHKGTRMNVRGAIRVRNIQRTITCPYCQNEEPLDYRVLEVVASNINYTANWDKPPTGEPEETEEPLFDEDDTNE